MFTRLCVALAGMFMLSACPPAPQKPTPPAPPVTGEIKPTEEREPRVAPRKLPLSDTDAVLVLSPVSVQQVSSALTGEASTPGAKAGETQTVSRRSPTTTLPSARWSVGSSSEVCIPYRKP